MKTLYILNHYGRMRIMAKLCEDCILRPLTLNEIESLVDNGTIIDGSEQTMTIPHGVYHKLTTIDLLRLTKD